MGPRGSVGGAEALVTVSRDGATAGCRGATVPWSAAGRDTGSSTKPETVTEPVAAEEVEGGAERALSEEVRRGLEARDRERALARSMASLCSSKVSTVQWRQKAHLSSAEHKACFPTRQGTQRGWSSQVLRKCLHCEACFLGAL